MRSVLAPLCIGAALAGCATVQGGPLSPLAKLHGDLHLTADQETAWSQYATAMSDAPQMEGRREAAERMLPQLPTPRRLALIDAAMTDELNAFHRQSQATKALYSRLTPDQQKTFDRETLPLTAAIGP